MGVINQPNSQIRLTNVSLVRMKKGKKRFEIACYQNKVQDWRSKIEKDLDEVLQIPQVFQNVSKGQVANNEDLMASFGTTNQDEIILEILTKGEIQLNEKERNANLQQKQNEFLNIISTKCINPKSKKRYPPSMLQKALDQLKFHLNPTKSTKLQALDAIKLLVEKQVFPIARAQMKVKVVLTKKAYAKVFEEIKGNIDSIEDESKDAKGVEIVCIIDPINYRTILDVLEGVEGQGSVEVLDMMALLG
ncbi:Shwachman-Bodian-diamond syndrome protein [Suhomyces tanzawaensis NRRL Y-17324]|uniref:Ribosome maturation protein SDO1 n=1 Tax=Suhomyces tanzawaensis NRRL Y-17324 TaxID=984487 RepID=A0A1E4SG76_9ASCO|nr:Shwachman-Bodian-diamond syndrome protein [Suhomyces tanzawaensis NRRL Y-17324]ODV78412.1 Shwachman-Bodian-diamond syndrome protein [Suhomyces tanzawaensis NRRL Y-17324]